jgi:FAD-linked sulfhydryl oxidase
MTIHITPDIWGPKLWMSIHFIALAYPISPTEEHKKNYKTFYETLQYVLPCSLCANNYKEHLKIKPLNDSVLKDKESLVKWTIDMHNLVNKENNKEVLSYDKAIDLILNNFKEVESDIKKDNDKNLSSIQNNLIDKKKRKKKKQLRNITKI